MSLADFERYPLTFGPSPIHPLNRLTEYLGGAQIWVYALGPGVVN